MPRGVNALDEARLQGRLWTPDIDGAARWLDFADLSTMTSSTGISAVRCKASGLSFSQATASKQPTLVFRDGRPDGLRFVKTAGQILIAAGVVSSARFTALLMTTESGSGSTMEPLYNGNAASNGWGYLYNWSGDPNRLQGIYGAVAVLQAASTRTPNATYITTLGRRASDNIFEVNETSFTVASANFASPTGNIGVGGDGTRDADHYDGTIHGVLIYPRELTVYERQRAAAFLAWNHGRREILSAANPFRNRPPLIGD